MRMKLFFMVKAESSKNLALWSIEYACVESFYVMLRASSIVVVMRSACPTGPRPFLMNMESIKGAAKPAFNWV